MPESSFPKIAKSLQSCLLEVGAALAGATEGPGRHSLSECSQHLTAALSALEPAAPRAEPPPFTHRAGNERRRIMVVDDDEDSQRIISFFLKKKNLEILPFLDPREALAQVMQLQPDAILLDLMMPQMNGFEFLEAIHKLPGGARFKIIVGSGRNYVKDRLRGLELGAVDFVDKPYNMNELYLRLQKCFS